VGVFSVFLVALGLSMDVFAVSITSGMVTNKLKVKEAIKMGAYYALFQSIAPIIGWGIGVQLRNYLMSISSYIAFGILMIIGIKMLAEALVEKNEVKEFKNFSYRAFPLVALAVSFDEIAAGLSFAFLKVSIIEVVLIIGVTTFVVTFIGVLVGRKFGAMLKKKSGLVGGVIFILIGLQRLLEHLKIVKLL
jgi:putative Mn2+ efflux pump MntP